MNTDEVEKKLRQLAAELGEGADVFVVARYNGGEESCSFMHGSSKVIGALVLESIASSFPKYIGESIAVALLARAAGITDLESKDTEAAEAFTSSLMKYIEVYKLSLNNKDTKHESKKWQS